MRKTDNVRNVSWLGHPIWQYPLDAWVLQEVISELRPDLIIETGTYEGGSALYFASLCDLLGHGEIVSIDIAPKATPEHRRITYITNSSIAEETLTLVRKRIDDLLAKRVLVVLDSEHKASHVRQELEAYSPLVSIDSYLHVQDGMLDLLPRFRGNGPAQPPRSRSSLRTTRSSCAIST